MMKIFNKSRIPIIILLSAIVTLAVSVIVISESRANDPVVEAAERSGNDLVVKATERGGNDSAVEAAERGENDSVVEAAERGGNDSVVEAAERAKRVALAHRDGNDSVVARVDDDPITQQEFAWRKEFVETNLEYMDGEIAAGAYDREYLEAYAALIREVGTPTVALTGAILDSALHQYAIEQGYSVTLDEVEERVQKDRDLSNQMGAEAAPEEAYIEVFGEERYWSEIYPGWIERNLPIQKLLGDRTADLSSLEEHREVSDQVNREALQGRDIRIVDQEAVGSATVDSVRNYINRIVQLRAESNRQ